ncbi:ribosome biogenesis protein BMS1 [Blastomyces parvus]|uniref:Ribosome biogenesis protein BMS1 n=1 Tax=Blastomyces parvus TaxID=2060905 RepID=A0A2B7X1P8_9EURO|nr:ribosome biogenesis protein BMS1 [Blastomyces parvus]
MAIVQIAINGNDCYQLLSDGTVKQLVAYRWKTLDDNAGNAQIAVGDNGVYLRRSTGMVYVYSRDDGSWGQIGQGAAKIWASGSNNLYMWNSATKVLQKYLFSEKQWKTIDGGPRFKDLAVDGDAVYQLKTDGAVWSYDGIWHDLNSDDHTCEIAAGGGHLYMRHSDGHVYQHVGTTQWTKISNMDSHAVQIAAGEEGVFKRRENGGIYKHVSGMSWKKVSGDIANCGMAAGKYLYRVTTENTIARLVFNGTSWQMLQTPTGWRTPYVSPAEVYNGGYTEKIEGIGLRIGNGAAGQSHLIKALADAFIKFKVSQGKPHFSVAWIKSDTTESIHYMKSGSVEACITYNAAAEQLAIDQNIAGDPSYYAFREHFLLVGPPSNPAKLDSSASVVEMFQSIYTFAESGKNVKFLSRFDKSATNIKESELWLKIGQAPWAQKKSEWYHENAEYPIQALTTAAKLGEYTLTDWGTYLSVTEEVRKNLTIYKKGTDEEDDPLLMPAHLLVSDQSPFAKEFAHWLVSQEGQAVVASFKIDGQQVYSAAP